ncbi:hypothetical protein HPB52_016691 [Rhipicephalus sanguineus]|uniref:p53 DNA-binding domain-containing protein n=1 Tax=Rhipicephalus sanguineus TaxID=34632 RepID=A0A9D4SZA8_RHISA|nr:hypothetical protein HPB52_016691 [Rhipicephalus sanguineus]
MSTQRSEPLFLQRDITVQMQAEQQYTVYHLRFMCLSSCHTGINRRGVKLVWTLENNGSIIGRQVIDLKLCACPGRDRKNEEKMSNREMNSSLLEGVIGGSVAHPVANNPSRLSGNTTFSQTRPQKRGLMSVATVITGDITGAPAKIRKTEQEPDREYTLKLISPHSLCRFYTVDINTFQGRWNII